jgi:hypothetical protein
MTSGFFHRMTGDPKFNIVLVHEDSGTGVNEAGSFDKVISYSAKELKISL